MTCQQLEERQKEEETLRHQIRKVSEEKSILHDRLDQLKKDFLELNPRKDQKARVDAAYEKQKGKLKQKIAHLEKKKAQLENKLRQPSEMDVSKRDHMRGSSDANSNSLIDFDSSDPTLDFTASETSLNNHSSLTNKNSNLSLASMDSKSVGGSSEPDNLQFNAHISHEQLAELVAQLQSYKEYFEDIAMKKLEQKQMECEDELRNLHSSTEKNRQFMEQSNEIQNDRVDQLESEIHEHSDIRSAEFTRLKQDIDQQWNMVSYRSNEKNNEIIERLEKLEARFDDLASRVRINKTHENTQMSGVWSKHFQTGIELLIHLVGLVLILIKYILQIISPFTRTVTHTLASLLFIILSVVLYRIWQSQLQSQM
jgi:chromosome segregation ATPase